MPYIYIFTYVILLIKQVRVGAVVAVVTLVFSVVAVISSLVFHDHRHRKMFVGSVGLVASIAMYGSPLVAVVSLSLSLTSRKTA